MGVEHIQKKSNHFCYPKFKNLVWILVGQFWLSLEANIKFGMSHGCIKNTLHCFIKKIAERNLSLPWKTGFGNQVLAIRSATKLDPEVDAAATRAGSEVLRQYKCMYVSISVQPYGTRVHVTRVMFLSFSFDFFLFSLILFDVFSFLEFSF